LTRRKQSAKQLFARRILRSFQGFPSGSITSPHW